MQRGSSFSAAAAAPSSKLQRRSSCNGGADARPSQLLPRRSCNGGAGTKRRRGGSCNGGAGTGGAPHLAATQGTFPPHPFVLLFAPLDCSFPPFVWSFVVIYLRVKTAFLPCSCRMVENAAYRRGIFSDLHAGPPSLSQVVMQRVPPSSIRLISGVVFLFLKPFRFVLVVNFFLFCYLTAALRLPSPSPSSAREHLLRGSSCRGGVGCGGGASCGRGKPATGEQLR